MMHPIYVLWAVPRSTSTAFEWMMRMRGDMTCFHEPFGEAWYKGDDARWPRLTAESPRVRGLTFAGVWERMLAAAEAGPVFSKEMTYHVEHMATDAFLDHFTHSFLIRDPAKSVTSVHRHGPEFTLKEVGVIEQRTLFDRLSERAGTPPPVIDSDDLLEDPHGMVAAWCAAVGIAFIPEALSWQPGARDEVSWYDGGSWHETLRRSDGLKPQPRRAVDIADAPERVRETWRTVLPHYQHMHRYRLRPERVAAG